MKCKQHVVYLEANICGSIFDSEDKHFAGRHHFTG